MHQCRITVFTPTFNRAYIIENLYRSLQRQTCMNFEWLVVDDGSSDHTETLFREWIGQANPFPIRYYKQNNGGKHRAINTGLDLANGEWFFTVDSDDYLTDDALEKVEKWCAEADSGIQGIVANRGYSSTETINYLFEEKYLDRTFLDMSTFTRDGRLVLGGEKAIILRTDFHRRYKFPEFKNENFMTEGVVYNRMAADGYKMRFYNDIIWVFEYMDDGLTKAGGSIFLKNPRGYGLFMKERAEFLHWSKLQVLRMWYTFTCDLSDRYSSKDIAEFIGAPRLLIAFINACHKMIHRIRK